MHYIKDRFQFRMNIRSSLLMFWDASAIICAMYFALYLRFDGHINPVFLNHFKNVWLFFVIIGIIVFFIFKMYQSLWEFASIAELKNIVFATFIVAFLQAVICKFSANSLPRSCYIMSFFIITALSGGMRFLYRLMLSYHKDNTKGKEVSKVLIIGAGDAGEILAEEIQMSSSIFKEVKCFIDDDKNKWGRYIHSVPVIGGKDKILEVVQKYGIQEIFIAMPSVSKHKIAETLNICKQTKCQLKILPGIYQIVNGNVNISKLKDVEIQDLLGRDPIQVDLNEIMGYVSNQIVMVTGGGGSIGSELCRQIAGANPKQLIIVDIYENNAYDIQLELKRNYPDLDLETMIASVRDYGKVKALFERFHPDIVFHAAAHKHVPLMEDSPNEAVKNNVFGTYHVAKASDAYHVKKFILISTDKAVNPTNIMGATKRLCEMVIQTYNKQSQTDYVAVRFGNVLGSNGSVIPLFKKQIEKGGPVTVTHPDITRYFMTIPEAVSLVLQAGAYAKGGEIFVLDMGEPVKIVDMARSLIKLSGLEPDVDIKIEFTGLRPGEKLYEEMLMEEEGLETTPNQMIHIGKPIELDEKNFFIQLEKLYEAAYAETTQMKELVHQLVDTYQTTDVLHG